MANPILSVITPAFNEENNLEPLYQQLAQVMNDLKVNWEWILVDDHSTDRTPEIARLLQKKNSNIKIFRFSKNFGSHLAIRCGLDQCSGQAAVVLASDLQDDPSVIQNLFQEWKKGAPIIWAARDPKRIQKFSLFSKVYYRVMRDWVGLKGIPQYGADFFMIDRQVVEALKKFSESNASIFALISWLGFSQTTVFYQKKERRSGRSGWTFEKKIKLFIDSVASFSYFPIRLISVVGFLVALAGFAYAILILGYVFAGERPAGWASLMVVLLVVGGLQMLMMGVLGEYLWRALDESRKRPKYILEQNFNSSDKSDHS